MATFDGDRIADKLLGEVINEKKKEVVNEEASTVSTDIDIPGIPVGKDKKMIEPDCMFNGFPCFNVDSNDFFAASTHRRNGTRHKIRNEKVRQFMKENGWRMPFMIKYEGNHFRVK